jgi:hypothetical protein
LFMCGMCKRDIPAVLVWQIPEYISNIPQRATTLDTDKENTKLEKSTSSVSVGSGYAYPEQ